MVRVKSEKLVAGDNGVLHMQDLYGLSTDTKPTDGMATGSTFLEIDTGIKNYFDEDSSDWVVPAAE